MRVLIFKIVEMNEDVGPACQLGRALHAEPLQDADKLPAPGEVQVDDALRTPLDVHEIDQLLVGGGNASGAAASRLAPVAPDTLESHGRLRVSA